MTIATRRQTAGNNAFLADCKYWFNKPLYARIAATVNDPERGEAAARAYILQTITTNEQHVADLGSGKRTF